MRPRCQRRRRQRQRRRQWWTLLGTITIVIWLKMGQGTDMYMKMKWINSLNTTQCTHLVRKRLISVRWQVSISNSKQWPNKWNATKWHRARLSNRQPNDSVIPMKRKWSWTLMEARPKLFLLNPTRFASQLCVRWCHLHTYIITFHVFGTQIIKTKTSSSKMMRSSTSVLNKINNNNNKTARNQCKTNTKLSHRLSLKQNAQYCPFSLSIVFELHS